MFDIVDLTSRDFMRQELENLSHQLLGVCVRVLFECPFDMRQKFALGPF